MSSYKLSLNSVRSINRTIVTVNQMRKTGVVGDLPFRQNQKRQPAAGTTLQIGKTKPFSEDSAFWENESGADLYVYEFKEGDTRYEQKLDKEGNPVVAKNIYNMFGPVLPDSWVQWQGATRTDSQQDVLFGKTTAIWKVGDFASITPLDKDENVLCNPGFRVLNLFAEVEANKWVAFMPNIYTPPILISAEC
ncbi:MAG: hypothetical protein ACR2NI_12335 [Pirellulales bacterium]